MHASTEKTYIIFKLYLNCCLLIWTPNWMFNYFHQHLKIYNHYNSDVKYNCVVAVAIPMFGEQKMF